MNMKSLKEKISKLHSIDELNTTTHLPDSHEGRTSRSTLMMDFRHNFIFKPEMLGTGTAHYPRLITMSDGRYILFYNTGKTRPDVYYITSSDLREWSEPKILFESDGASTYATCDGVVLSNGDLLCCASKHPSDWKSYTQDMNSNFLVTKRSCDNGVSFSDEQIVYTGMNWEPSLLQLDGGEVQIYFTQTATYTALYGYDVSIRSSGSSMIRSYDNGYTWTPDVRADNVDPMDPYCAIRVMQQKIGEKEVVCPFTGQKTIKPWFNDQMPVAIQLNNKSIAVTAESLLHFYEHPVNGGKYQVSIAFSHDNWKTVIGREEEGPSDRINNLDRAAGPYISQFPSGEVMLSHTNQYSQFEYKIGDPTAHVFSRDYVFNIGVKNLWSMTEILNSHRIACIADDGNNSEGAKNGTLSLGYAELLLNHDIFVKLTDYENAWNVNTDALFVGSVSQAQMALRFSHDSDRLYVLAEVLDKCITNYDQVTVYIRVKEEVHKFSCNPFGDTMNYKANCRVIADIYYEQDSNRAGYAVEFSIDKDFLGITDQTYSFYVLPELINNDNNGTCLKDTIPFADIHANDPSNCPLVTFI